jgi:hypothetical protein
MTNHTTYYAHDEIRRMEHERRDPVRLHRERWLRDREARVRTRRRAAVAWLALRLIALGQRLHTWATPEAMLDFSAPTRRPA